MHTIRVNNQSYAILKIMSRNHNMTIGELADLSIQSHSNWDVFINRFYTLCPFCHCSNNVGTSACIECGTNLKR